MESTQRTPFNIGFLKLCLEVELGGPKNRSLSCEIDGFASRVAQYCIYPGTLYVRILRFKAHWQNP